jgi:RIO kinase 1
LSGNEEGIDQAKLKRALDALRRLEYRDRFRIKGEEQREVLEQVFDERTLMTLYELANRGIFRVLGGAISTGKEARVFWARTEEGSELAVKIFAYAAVRFKHRLPYIAGDPRFKRFPRRSHKFIDIWARKEFANLSQAYQAGVSVPRPYAVRRNVLVMQFIGKEGVPAPRLVDAKERLKTAHYNMILEEVAKLYSKARLVHADLSEFNVFYWEDAVVLFDFGSAVDIAHPSANAFLIRDLTNINRFFSELGFSVLPLEELLARMS